MRDRRERNFGRQRRRRPGRGDEQQYWLSRGRRLPRYSAGAATLQRVERFRAVPAAHPAANNVSSRSLLVVLWSARDWSWHER